MPTFDGVHGTTLSYANNICINNFRIPDHAPGHSMYGNGVYFYGNSNKAKKAAKKWGKIRAKDSGLAGECACLIYANIEYREIDEFWFPRLDFDEKVAALEKQYRFSMDNERKNMMRVDFIDAEVKKQRKTGKVVLAMIPAFRDTLPGCVLRDATVLPPPSVYKKEVCGNVEWIK